MSRMGWSQASDMRSGRMRSSRKIRPFGLLPDIPEKQTPRGQATGSKTIERRLSVALMID
ncbi:MAG: hypothetical protein ACRETY_12245 [Steroidobacteraceae bacterium]